MVRKRSLVEKERREQRDCGRDVTKTRQGKKEIAREDQLWSFGKRQYVLLE